MFEGFKARKAAKKQKLREKNFKLAQEGKDIHKGWGKMMDTGVGGLNKLDNIEVTKTGKLDNMGYRQNQAEEIGKENEERKR